MRPSSRNARWSDDSLNEKLVALQRKMAELRSQLGTEGGISNGLLGTTARPAVRPPLTPTPPRATELLPPVPRGSVEREPFMHWLVSAVRVRSGIAIEKQVRQKLSRITARLPLIELEKWLSLLSCVESSHPEWIALLESLPNHETYFFRDFGQLEQLQREIIAPLVAREGPKANPSLTVWSATSSSGEELFSVAMLLLEELEKLGETEPDGPSIRAKSRWNLRLLGTDISRQVVRLATTGVYDGSPHGSFRKFPPRFQRFFSPVEDGDGTFRRVRDGVRRGVSCQTFNLMDATPPLGPCDVVLCRNVLIYFDQNGKRAVWNLVHRALAANGVALFGPTDMLDDKEGVFPDVGKFDGGVPQSVRGGTDGWLGPSSPTSGCLRGG